MFPSITGEAADGKVGAGICVAVLALASLAAANFAG